MATIKETAELAFRQIFPNPGDETGIDRDEFVATAKSIYARAVWILSKQEKALEGMFNIPSHLLTETKLDVVDGEIDLSGLNIMRSLSANTWLQNIGGLVCDCTYIGSDVNLTQLLCDDEFQGETKTFIIIGNKIRFPQGVHASPLAIIYASDGSDVDMDEALAATVREQLTNLYLHKGTEDTTNNTNADK